MATRHSAQTGIREILSSGALQSLQSDGKRTEKTLRSRVCKGATRRARCPARCCRCFRFSVSRLLKTTLQPLHTMPTNWAHKMEPCRRRRGLPEQRWLALVRSRSTVTHQYMDIEERV